MQMRTLTGICVDVYIYIYIVRDMYTYNYGARTNYTYGIMEYGYSDNNCGNILET